MNIIMLSKKSLMRLLRAIHSTFLITQTEILHNNNIMIINLNSIFHLLLFKNLRIL